MHAGIYNLDILQQDLILPVDYFQVLSKLLPEHEQLSEPRKEIPSRCVYKATIEVMNKS